MDKKYCLKSTPEIRIALMYLISKARQYWNCILLILVAGATRKEPLVVALIDAWKSDFTTD
jgi:hypothetical protein